MFGLGDLVDFRYELALGDETLDSGRTRRAGQAQGSAGAAARPVGGARRPAPAGGAEVPGSAAARDHARRGRAAGRAARADDDLPVVAWTPTAGWATCCPARPTSGSRPASTPASFRGELRPYQERGLAWLSFLGDLGLGGILADDMGSGKCVLPHNAVFVNGSLLAAEDVWNRFATDTWSDGEGEWAVPADAAHHQRAGQSRRPREGRPQPGSHACTASASARRSAGSALMTEARSASPGSTSCSASTTGPVNSRPATGYAFPAVWSGPASRLIRISPPCWPGR